MSTSCLSYDDDRKENRCVNLSDVKTAIKEGTIVEMTGPPDFAGITYTVRGLIMRLGHDRQTGQPYWLYLAELADKTGCIVNAPLDKVVVK